MSPYREPPPPPRRRWWQRLACAVGRHEWLGPPREFRFGTFMPCAHCAAQLCRSRSVIDFTGDHYLIVTRDPLPPVE